MGVAKETSKQIQLGQLLLNERPDLVPPVHLVAAAREIGIFTPDHHQVRRQMANLITMYYNGVLQLDGHWGIGFASGSGTADLQDTIRYLQNRVTYPKLKPKHTPDGPREAHKVNRRRA